MSTPTENVQEPNFEQNAYNQTHVGQNQAQSLNNQPSHAGQSVQNPEPTSIANPNASYNQMQGHTQDPSISQSSTGQIQNHEPTNQNTTPSNQNMNNQSAEIQSPTVVPNEPVPKNPVETQPKKPEETLESKPEPSVFDLLSDIDFTVETKTLMPDIKVPQISESAIKKPIHRAEPVKKPVIKEEVTERPAKRDLFTDPSLMNQFTQEVKNLQRLTETLTNKAGSGLTVLDSKWKTFQDVQVRNKRIKLFKKKKNLLQI